jgi:hypothetical protein
MKLLKIKALALSLTAALSTLSCFSGLETMAQETYLIGDADSNGTVDAIDASLVLAYYAATQTNGSSNLLKGIQLTAADVDKSATIDALDASFILAMYASVQTAASSVTSDGHIYAVIDSSYSWTQAEQYCEKLGGHLATISNSKEQSLVTSLASKSLKTNFWIGGYYDDDKMKWCWVDGTPFTYTNWDTTSLNIIQPDNYWGDEYYIRFANSDITYSDWYAHKGGWNDTGNEADGISGDVPLSSFGFICEWD